MINKLFLLQVILYCFNVFTLKAQTDPVILAYYPSWQEDFASTNTGSKLRNIPAYVNHVFLGFAKPNMTYVKDSYDLTGTGVQTPYDGCALKESVSALSDKGIKVILSVGGETYWATPDAYNINYSQIKDFVDDIGFAGIDWDYEPDGSFSGIGTPTNVAHFIDFFTQSRAIMSRADGYLMACAPSGVGALGGLNNDDASSPYAYANRNALTGETDTNLYAATAATNGINLFGFSATGHMIPVMAAVGDMIDLVALQGYNVGGSLNREIMYDSYAHYADIHGFKIASGVHFPDEPWGPLYEYTHANVASLSEHIETYPTRVGSGDGIMIWQLLLADGATSSAYSYLNVASKVLNGTSEAVAIADANTWALEPYTGGAAGGCTSGGGTTYCSVSEYVITNSYSVAGTQVYFNCKVWENLWFANAGEAPESNSVWAEVSDCGEGPGCTLATSEYELSKFKIYQLDDKLYYTLPEFNGKSELRLFDIKGSIIVVTSDNNSEGFMVLPKLSQGVYILQIKQDENVISKKVLIN